MLKKSLVLLLIISLDHPQNTDTTTTWGHAPVCFRYYLTVNRLVGFYLRQRRYVPKKWVKANHWKWNLTSVLQQRAPSLFLLWNGRLSTSYVRTHTHKHTLVDSSSGFFFFFFLTVFGGEGTNNGGSWPRPPRACVLQVSGSFPRCSNSLV